MTFSALTIFILGLVAAVVLVVGLWRTGRRTDSIDCMCVRISRGWRSMRLCPVVPRLSARRLWT